MSRTRRRLRPRFDGGRTGRTEPEEHAMRKLIVQQWVTVDNIAAEEDGGLSFVTVAPFTEDEKSAYKTNVMEFIDSVDTMILGANTYAMSKDYWPHAKDQGEYGEKLN